MNNTTENDFYLMSVAACLIIKKKKPKKRWCKDWLLKRHKLTHINLMNELTLEPSDWRNYLRMDEPTYFQLLKLVTPLIQKKDTNMREAISPHERLSATIRFLASGMTYEELKFITLISPQRLGVIIPETCKAILHVLKDYIKMPETVADWKQISKAFEERWQFPNCLGAIDGKHVRIMPPSDSGSFFHNYKGYSSIVLMACANANYEFIWCEVGINGRISDGGSIKQTQFYKDLISNNLNIPSIERSQTSTVLLPYVFVGDEAFSLRTDFMKPFGKNSLTAERKVYNYRLSRARRVIENIFGIMSNRFRIFHTPINLRLDRIDLVVMTCCVLHNFLRKSSSPYATSDLFEMDDITDEDVIPSPAFNSLERMNGNATQDAKSVREAYVAYFNGEGSVSWQNDRIGYQNY